jgi:hypothetical protein
MLYSMMAHYKSSKWVDLLPLVTANYNSSSHGTTGAKPVDLMRAARRCVVQVQHEAKEANLREDEANLPEDQVQDEAKGNSVCTADDDAMLAKARRRIGQAALKMMTRRGHHRLLRSLPTIHAGDFVRIEAIDAKKKTNWSVELYQVVNVSSPAVDAKLGVPRSLPQLRLAGPVPDKDDLEGQTDDDDDDDAEGQENSESEETDGNDDDEGQASDDDDDDAANVPSGDGELLVKGLPRLSERFYRADLQLVNRKALRVFRGTKPDFSNGELFDLEAHLDAVHACSIDQESKVQQQQLIDAHRRTPFRTQQQERAARRRRGAQGQRQRRKPKRLIEQSE